MVGMLAYEFQVVLPVVARSTLPRRRAGVRLPDGGDGDRCRRRRPGGRVRARSPAPKPWSGPRRCLRRRHPARRRGAEPGARHASPWRWSAPAASASWRSAMPRLQLNASPTMRGRVMALWAVAFLGSTPIGGPIAGYVSEHFGGRAGSCSAALPAWSPAAAAGWALRRASWPPPAADGRSRRRSRSPASLAA